MAAIDVQCGQRAFERMLDLLMEYIFPDDEIILSTRAEESFEKMMGRMQDCGVVVKPQRQRKDKT